MSILIGADPELFLMKDNEFQSAWNIIPGTKKAPFKVYKGAVQVDGMALEFNIDPAPDSVSFVQNINAVLEQLRNMVPDEYHLALTSTAEFTDEHIKDQPQVALELGCDPDFNAYTLEPNEPPKPNNTMRAAGGHVHVGWTEGANVYDPKHIAGCASLVKEMDVVLGLSSLYLDKDQKRRELYGGAGAFRPKSYGLEYRVLSNFWLHSEPLMEFVFHNAFKAIYNMQNNSAKYIQLQEAVPGEYDIEHAINHCDLGIASAVLDMFNIHLPRA